MRRDTAAGLLALAGLVLGGLFVLALMFSGWSYIDQGHRGIYICWGKRINPEPVLPGFQWKRPWCDYQQISVRIKDARLNNQSVKTAEGLNVKMTAVLRHRIKASQVNEIFDNIGGPGAIREKVANSFQAALKKVADQYSDEELYKTRASEYAEGVEKELRENTLGPLGFEVSHVLLNNVDLPGSVEEAIARKTEMKHKRQEKQRAVEVEKAEKRRKIVEAEGIAESNRIIGRSLSREYLHWYWIQEGLKKGDAVYVPVGEDALPIYKDVDSIKEQE